MFVTPAYAQAAGGTGGAMDIVSSLFPILILIVIFYMLIWKKTSRTLS